MSARSVMTILASGTICLMTLPAPAAPPSTQWLQYGGGPDGTRFASSSIITPENIGELTPAWSFQTGDATVDDRYFGRQSSFKATPVLLGNKLIFSTGFNRVIAIDAESGEQLWRYDPEVSFKTEYSEMFTSRGVTGWIDTAAKTNSPCASRIFLGTLDARLIAVDANTGKVCVSFGDKGEIDLSRGIRNYRRGDYSVTSPPTVVNNLVITGSSIGDNGGVELEAGTVRAFDARTGRQLWQWDPIPRRAEDSGWHSWEDGAGRRTGAANVWSVMAADPQRDLVFLPTTSPSPDFYGGARLGDNQYANSIVALKASTGELVWAYQIVRHDLWDYDLASQPMLMDVPVDGEMCPAVVLATKMGFVFVLDRETGKPLFPVTEMEVPSSDVPGEQVAATQRFASIQLHRTDKTLPKLWQHSEEHVRTCQRMLEGVRFEGPFTPPGLGGTMLFPGNPGGVNWGSMAAHQERQVAFVAVNRLPTVVRLIPRKDFSRLARTGQVNGFDAQYTEQSGTPYGMARFDLYNRETNFHCFEGPWATLVALDMTSGEVLWEQPAGTVPGMPADSEVQQWGYYVNGGPLATGGGVVFLATPFDSTIRAYDMRDGNVLWSATLQAQPHATPMSYELNGVQYVVIAAGGNRADGKGRGDYLVSFKLSKAKVAK